MYLVVPISVKFFKGCVKDQMPLVAYEFIGLTGDRSPTTCPAKKDV
jgi:hypothetical protein